MKIRMGFVSNSSSSSFCIFGIRFDGTENEAYEFVKDTELVAETTISGYDEVYIGLYPESMKDEETLLNFKERIIRQLAVKDAQYKDVTLSWITDGGYNG